MTVRDASAPAGVQEERSWWSRRLASPPFVTLFESLGLALFPPRCESCRRWLDGGLRFALCGPCFESLTPNDGPRCARCDQPGAVWCSSCKKEAPPFAALRAPWIYGGAMAELIAAAKFRGREEVARQLGRLLSADPAVLALARGCDAVVPIPLGRRRRAGRGYNPSAVLARELGDAADRPVLHALRRVRETAAQSELPLAARKRNLDGAFRATGRVMGAILIVDDVVTSSETARQAAVALKAAGAERIVVAAVSRAP